MANGLRRAVALVGMPTSHGVPVIPSLVPGSVSGPGGLSVVRVGLDHIAAHFVGDTLHSPNPVAPGSGSQLVTADGMPLAFVGDSFV